MPSHLELFESKIVKSRWNRCNTVHDKEIHYDRIRPISDLSIKVPIWYSFDVVTGELTRIEKYTSPHKFGGDGEHCVLNFLHYQNEELYSDEFVELSSGMPIHVWSMDLYYTLTEPKVNQVYDNDIEWISRQGNQVVDLGVTIEGWHSFHECPWKFKKILTQFGVRYIECDDIVRPYRDYIKSGQWLKEI
jgi:hypothetical protein